MTISDLQQRLTALGFYHGAIDGQYGDETRSALLAAFHGRETPLQAADVASAAMVLGVTPAHIRTVRDVEAAGAGFADNFPKILFEGHIFSKLTGHQFDSNHPDVSYPHWDRSKYPPSQAGRYHQLVEAVGLDPDAAFSSASYGAFQILGENYKACGFTSPFEFVLAMCQSEGAQLIAFVNFLKATHLDAALRENRWSDFARGYNGSAYKANAYDTKLANAYSKESAIHDVPAPAMPVAPAAPAAPEAQPQPAPTPVQPAAPATPLPAPQAPQPVPVSQPSGFAAILQQIIAALPQIISALMALFSKKAPA